MRVNLRIDCSPNEFRRLCGEPDVSPLLQSIASALERWLKHRIASLDVVPPESGECSGAASDGGPRV